MPTAEQVVQAIKNTFELQDDVNLASLVSSPKISAIDGLSDLLIILADEKSPPRIIGRALEEVVLGLKQKNKPTDLEQELDRQIQVLVYDPQYSLGRSSP
ncbi:MAG: hypothetical protein P1U36_06250 [Legionellaceae bacterium]|nr:hypothetical protein [Legionellaceae bacterium]